MHPLLHYSSSFLFLAIVFAFLGLSNPFKFLRDEAKFKACRTEFNCGAISNLRYPFWGGDQIQDCGHPQFNLECHNSSTYPQIQIMLRKFTILDIKQTQQILTVVGADMVDDGCPERFANITVDDSPFECASNNIKLTYVYNCSNGIPSTVPPELICAGDNPTVCDGYYIVEPRDFPQETQLCNTINIPLLQKYYTDIVSHHLTAKNALKKGFDLRYKDDHGQAACGECLKSSGKCGFNRNLEEFVCFSHQGMYF